MAHPSERTIFLEALERDTAAAQAAYLDQACAGDPALRQSVEQLLAAHVQPHNRLDLPVGQTLASAARDWNAACLDSAAAAESEGDTIDSYRLRERIGEGGFGLVYVAEQEKPVRRKVALKVIKPGMDSREVIARFEAERQALALMDHPNIAKVFDAGVTAAGRPYFVMELVRGVPITEFCQVKPLTLRQRLELFIQVCAAVQHAHQKGVIHRDLKPSNVLVTLHDDIAVPKVIDFGVAKAIGQTLTDKTIYTRFAAMIGTPLYMSPEQAEMSGLDVDTRSDIYSLGVLLYELLTGLTPFDRQRFKTVGLDEMRRIIREEDPPRPSTRLSTAAPGSGPTVAEAVPGAQRRLSTAIRGDLDWVVMKSLEKDRSRRYESASALADDLRRFLQEKPVVARPPSRVYQLRKFARRNRGVLLASTLIAATLLLGTAVSLWQASIAIGERNEKDIALQRAITLQREANEARDEIAQFATRLKEANVLVTRGRAHVDAERWAGAYADFSAAIEKQPSYYNGWNERASLEVKLGLWGLAAEDYAQAIELGLPLDSSANWGISQVFLITGDSQRHRDWCQQLLQQAEVAEQPPAMPVIRSCVMAPEPVGDPVQLADQALQWLARPEPDPRDGRGRPPEFSEPRLPGPPLRRPQARPPGPEGPPPGPPRGGPPPRPDERGLGFPRGTGHYIAGVALYRAGQYEASIAQLQLALRDDRWRAREVALPVLAMALHRTGQEEPARQTFARAEAAMDSWTESIQQGPLGALPIPWFDWVEIQLLHREASILLTGFAPADDPRLRDIQQRATQALRDPLQPTP